MTDVDPTVLEKVRARIERSFVERSVCLFVPEQFVKAGVGDVEQIRACLAQLTKQHFLEAEVEVRCGVGHSLWRGDVSQLESSGALRRACPSCDAEELDEEEPPVTFVRFGMTEPFKEVARGKKAQAALL